MLDTSSLIVTCGFSKFHYAVSDTAGRSLGELRLKTLPQDPITLDIDGKRYRIDYTVVSNRLLNNDFRFTLVGNDGPVVSAQKAPGKKHFAVDLRGVTYHFTNQSSLFSLRFALTDAAGRTAMTVKETTGFSLWRRRFRIDRPDNINEAVGMFLFFLATNLQYR
jgi:hypothetical protein